MLSSPLRASFVALVASVIRVSATPSLTIKASTPHTDVDGLENLKVITTIINTGDETLKLINDPRGVLDPFPEDSFIITNTAGSRPLFDGAMVNYASSYPNNTHLCFRFSAFRSSSAPRTLPASMIPTGLPFSLPVLTSMSPMIVRAMISIVFDSGVVS